MAQKQQNEEPAVAVIDEQPVAGEPPIDVVAAATAQAESWQRQEQQERDDDARAQWAVYNAIIIRRANPKPTDAADLAHVMRDLCIDRARLVEDIAIFDKAAELHTRHAGLAAANAKVCGLREAYNALKKRFERELWEAHRAKLLAEAEAEQASEARYELSKLSKQRPALFDQSTDPARLLSDS